MPTQGGGHIIIQSLIANPNTTDAERAVLQAMDSQATLCDHDIKWIGNLTEALCRR